MIKVENLRPGDIVGVTSGSPLATVIKLRTWGWKHAFDQTKASHIAVVVDRGQGLLYLAEMLSNGLDLNEIHEYDHTPPRSHICFVGRLPALDNLELRSKFNAFILEAHARKVKYGFEDLLKFLNIPLKDNQNTWICSELPREDCKKQAITYPNTWDKNCAPADWQRWNVLTNITTSIV